MEENEICDLNKVPEGIDFSSDNHECESPVPSDISKLNQNSKDIRFDSDYLEIEKSRREYNADDETDKENHKEDDKIERKHSARVESDSEEESLIADNFSATNSVEKEKHHSTILSSDNINEISEYSSKPRRKHKTVVDSDSEEEIVSATYYNEGHEQNTDLNSDSEDTSPSLLNKDLENFSRIRKQYKNIIESDSEDNDEITTHNKSFDDKTGKNEEAPIYTANYKGELITEETTTTKSTLTWTALCDPESSDEEIPENLTQNDNQENHDEVVEPMPYKKKTKSNGAETEKKMTGNDAAKLRKEIESESQRMIREMDVSLPYHRPKQFTLKEFLSRRPKLAYSVPSVSKMSPSVAIKMSKENLKDILKNLEKRKKEVQEFYKSESESEENDDIENDNMSPDKNTVSESINDASMPSQDTGVEETVQDSGIDSQEIMEDRSMESNESENDATKLNNVPIEIIEINCDGKLLSDESEQQDCPSETRQDMNIENLEGRHSMDYEFNLDGIEENNKSTEDIDEYKNILETEKDVDANLVPTVEEATVPNNSEVNGYPEELICPNNLKAVHPFEFTELDKEIENFGNIEVKRPTLSKMDLIREKLANIQPKLSGDESHAIDLDSVIIRPQQVSKLMERFLQHNTKHHHKNRVKVNVVSVESGQIHKETLAMSVDDEEDPTENEPTPGAKLKKLRCNLRDQIKQQRSEIWQKKIAEDNRGEEKASYGEEKDPYEGEKSDCGGDDDILDDDEEEEMSESSEEEEEEENEIRKPSREHKSAFVDDEAEESGEEANSEEDDENEDRLRDEHEDTALSNEQERVEEPSVNKTLKRIVKGFTEDSDDENDLSYTDNVSNVIFNLNKSISEESTQDDDYIPPYQIQNAKTPVSQATSPTKKSDFDFLTPISYITGLQNLNSGSKPKNQVIKSPFQKPNMPSPLKDSNWQSNLQKKLFSDSEITSSQAEAIAEMCSNNFPDSQESTNIKSCDQESTVDLPPCTLPPNSQDLLDICSGDFSNSAEPAIQSTQPPSSQDLLDICSGDFTMPSRDWPENSVVTHKFNPAEEIKQLGAEEDTIISQLLDEEEMATFKKKFDSPLMSATQKRIVEEFEEATAGGGVIDSDDDDDGLEVRKKKKKQMKLTFSDEESSDDDGDEKEEEIDLHDDIEEDDEDLPADNIEYDSEENEVEYVNDEDQLDGPKKPLKASDFFENEAELSESEWGSADEDEKDLDTLEFEEGDTEKFDEKKIRSDLERIHMRRVLDDDTREVKLLQELLLEDGELHGSGRERQFKWKNLDSMDNNDEDRKGDEDNETYLDDEDESEEQWRRRRFEREMFLKEKQSKIKAIAEEDTDIVEGSQFLKIGHKLIERSQNSSQNSIPAEKPTTTPGSPIIKSAFSFTHKRGSFLSRNDQVLQRLAEYNKEITSTALGTATAKNSRNFLFQTISTEKISETENKKRKTTDDTPRAIKKLRLSDNLSPAVKKKPGRLGAKAKLFGNH